MLNVDTIRAERPEPRDSQSSGLAGGSLVIRTLRSRYRTRKRWVQAGGHVIKGRLQLLPEEAPLALLSCNLHQI